jgi:8-oxo-dGTP pyrophosphatase MutT (NUDIX family)
MADIEKAGLLLLRDARILLCRKKRGSPLLILPGGKFEPGETAIECLQRELHEELGDVTATGLQHVGTYTDRAASDATKTVQIELYQGELAGTPVASAEIGELVWFGEAGDRTQLAPSLANRILPDLIARALLPWSPNDTR